jgi:hypothetical protein
MTVPPSPLAGRRKEVGVSPAAIEESFAFKKV